MSNSFGYIDIILLGMIAGFIILRLRSILGRKTGHESKAYPSFAQEKFNIQKKEIKPDINIKLTPEINTVAIQLPINNIDWPKSGWSINKINIEAKSKKLKKYFTWELWNFSKVKIFTVIKIKKGFNNSIGCNLKKYRFIQRLAPFTSTPIIGTKTKKKIEIKNKYKDILNRFFSLNEEKKINTHIPSNINIKCLKKKK